MVSCSAAAHQVLIQLIGDFMLNDDCFACDEVCATLCVRVFEAISQKSSKSCICKLALIAREYLWEVLHSKSWDDVPLHYRNAFSLFSIIVAYTIPDLTFDVSITSGNLGVTSLSIIDSGILLGSEFYRPFLLQLIERRGGERIECPDLLEVKVDIKSSISVEIDRYSQRTKISQKSLPSRIFLSKSEDISVRASNIERIKAPHLLKFLGAHLLLSRPVVLTDCMEEWSALQKWKNLEYYAEGILHGFCSFLYDNEKCLNLFWRPCSIGVSTDQIAELLHVF